MNDKRSLAGIYAAKDEIKPFEFKPLPELSKKHLSGFSLEEMENIFNSAVENSNLDHLEIEKKNKIIQEHKEWLEKAISIFDLDPAVKDWKSEFTKGSLYAYKMAMENIKGLEQAHA